MNEILAKLIAQGIIDMGIEGDYDTVEQSTAYDYPSLGVQQVEGGRADELLSMIGGERYMGRSYRDIVESGELYGLKSLLASEGGVAVQNAILERDCLAYVEELQNIETLDDTRCLLYAASWCPTSLYVVRRFLQHHEDDTNLRSLYDLYKLFEREYYVAADVGEYYREGYANRARNTYEYIADLDLTMFGIADYDE